MTNMNNINKHEQTSFPQESRIKLNLSVPTWISSIFRCDPCPSHEQYRPPSSPPPSSPNSSASRTLSHPLPLKTCFVFQAFPVKKKSFFWKYAILVLIYFKSNYVGYFYQIRERVVGYLYAVSNGIYKKCPFFRYWGKFGRAIGLIFPLLFKIYHNDMRWNGKIQILFSLCATYLTMTRTRNNPTTRYFYTKPKDFYITKIRTVLLPMKPTKK